MLSARSDLLSYCEAHRDAATEDGRVLALDGPRERDICDEISNSLASVSG